MLEKRKSRTWKFCENTVKDMWWNKVLPTKEWWRDPLTSYELDFCSDYVSIVKVKSQKVWSRSVDFCGDGEGKTWRGVDSTPPPPGWNRVKIKTKFHTTRSVGFDLVRAEIWKILPVFFLWRFCPPKPLTETRSMTSQKTETGASLNTCTYFMK